MNGPFEAIPVTDRIYWVGAIDWKIREFHGYATHRGTTYNAFLILDDKVTLIDTVKASYSDEMMSRVASVISPDKIDYIISNHSEMDHSGSLPRAIETMRPSQVFASKKGVATLGEHFPDLDFPLQEVDLENPLNLGNLHLRFLETRMLHWPDSMFCYVEEEELLFSQDGFGMHLASSERFADEIAEDILFREAAKYYANILLPFSPQVQRLLKSVSEMDLPIKMIAPDHGPIWRKDPSWIVEHYARWARQDLTTKVVVVFDTMWESTSKMARAIEEGLRAGGANPVVLTPLGSSHRSDVATELLDAGALIVGSPTLNNQLLPSIADVMTYLVGLRPKKVIGAAFGSYGWSGEAITRIEDFLDRMKVERVVEGIRVRYVPDEAALELCREMGKTVATTLLERIEPSCSC